MARDEPLAGYLEAATAWDDDRLRNAQASARRAWKVALAAMLVGLAALGVAAALAPLKTVVPYLIRVDSSTGIVDVVPTLAAPVAAGEAVTRHLLQLYVTARERFVADLAANDYAFVGAMQTAQLNERLLREWDRNNPNSPLNRYRDGAAVLVRVRSITFLPRSAAGSELAQVRFWTLLRPAGGGAEVEQPWIATLAYRFGPLPEDNAGRQSNPLGLRVSEYQREPEAAPSKSPGAEP